MEPVTKIRTRLTRAQKAGRTRQAILDAAMNIVGELGHSEASIANITRAANVALGTFYMHFESKQALLEELLPWAGGKAHAYMDAAIQGATNYAEYEVRNFDALYDFQRKYPFYYRLLSESEVATPDAYQKHIDRSIERYRLALAAAHQRGELPKYRSEDLEVLATMLSSIKLLLFTRYCTPKGPSVDMRRAYMTFVLSGLFGSTPEHASVSSKLASPVKAKRPRSTGSVKPRR